MMKPTFAKRLVAGAMGVIALGLTATTVQAAAAEVHHPHPVNGSWEGPFGRFDKAQLQRGFQVYKEVCSSCHSMNLLHYRNLGDEFGPFYDKKFPNPNESPVIKAIAASYTVTAVDPDGNSEERPGLPSDKFISPYDNRAQAQAANGGAVPPDMSVLLKARHNGGDYIYSLLTGYGKTPPKGFPVPEGKHYNPYMPGGVIAMAAPLSDGQVTYADTEANKGVKPTVDQMAHDVVAFLAWASEPHQTLRKVTGFGVMSFLFLLTILMWFSYKSVWRNVEH